MSITPQFETIESNGIRLRVALAGAGPLVVLVHGWPESWYSWRHQIPALVAAGYRVAAPDVRGYGGSDKPAEIAAYSLKSLAGDIAGLVAALGETSAILIGHDWGAPIVWNTALFFPERVRAVAGLSVPFSGRGPMPLIQLLQRMHRGRFFYQLYFQTPGVAEAELEADVATSLRKVYYWASGDFVRAGVKVDKPADATMLQDLPDPQPFPAWMSAADLAYYTAEFQGSGFRGPLNRYRCSEIDFADQEPFKEAKIAQPAAFIAGTLEPVLRFLPGVDMIEVMRGKMADLRLVEIIEGGGHWIQQEKPAETTAALLKFLKLVDG